MVTEFLCQTATHWRRRRGHQLLLNLCQFQLAVLAKHWMHRLCNDLFTRKESIPCVRHRATLGRGSKIVRCQKTREIVSSLRAYNMESHSSEAFKFPVHTLGRVNWVLKLTVVFASFFAYVLNWKRERYHNFLWTISIRAKQLLLTSVIRYLYANYKRGIARHWGKGQWW